jgi:hypothetical protein
MAKKGGKSKGNVSAGVHSNVSKDIRKAMRRDYLKSPERLINQLKAHRAGKRTMVTIENPNKTETDKPFIRVEGNLHFKQNFSSKKKNNALASEYDIS